MSLSQLQRYYFLFCIQKFPYLVKRWKFLQDIHIHIRRGIAIMKFSNTKKPRKLSTKIVLFAGSILLILNLILAIIMSVVTGIGMNRKQNAFLTQTASNAIYQVTNFIDKYSVLTQMLADNPLIQEAVKQSSPDQPYSSLPNYQTLTNLLQETTAQYPDDLLGMGVGIVSEGKIYTKDAKVITDITSLPIYDVVTQNKQIVTQPYVNSVTQTLNISICSPILDNGKTVGFVTVNVGLDNLSTFTSELSFGETGSVTLLSADNIVMGYNNADLIGQDFTSIEMSENLAQELNAPTGNVFQYDISNQTRKGSVTQLPDTNWKLIVGMARSEYSAQTDTTVICLLILLLLNMLIVGFSLRYIIVKKLQPLSELNKALYQMSQGNLHITVQHQSQDEVGQMAESMRSSIATLSSYVNEIDHIMARLAQGDLTVTSSVGFKGDFVSIQKSIFSFIETLTQLMRGILEASEQVSSSSEQVSSGAQELAEGATEQASSVEELANTISDLANTITSNAQMAQEANKNAVSVNQKIMESGEKMNQSLSLMNEIRGNANKVNGIIKAIEDIAFQTNILALNASVEAARAGVAGKGFAVVADEVGNLAAKSAEASKATTQLIQSMIASIQNGSESMQQTKQYMDTVVTEAIEITSTFQKISDASVHQTESIMQVTQRTDQISSVVQTNSATAEESAAASEELSGQAQMLKSLIHRFQNTENEENYYTVSQTQNATYDTAADTSLDTGSVLYSAADDMSDTFDTMSYHGNSKY